MYKLAPTHRTRTPHKAHHHPLFGRHTRLSHNSRRPPLGSSHSNFHTLATMTSATVSTTIPTICQFHPSHLAKYDTILFDIDGVIWRDHVLLPGILDTLDTLRSGDSPKSIFFNTNNSTKHRSTYPPHFSKAKLPITEDQFYTSASTAASYVASQVLKDTDPNSEDKVLLIGQDGLYREFLDRGMASNVIRINDLLAHAHIHSPHDLKTYPVDPRIKAVVSGLQIDFSYLHCAVACLTIAENQIPLIATNRDVTYPISMHRVLPGAGSVVNFIEGSCGTKAITMGKPNKYMIESLLRDHPEIDLKRTLFVGDRLDTDIQYGHNFGMDTLLVFTGVTKKDEYLTEKSVIQPSTEGCVSSHEKGEYYDAHGIILPTYCADDITSLTQ